MVEYILVVGLVGLGCIVAMIGLKLVLGLSLALLLQVYMIQNYQQYHINDSVI